LTCSDWTLILACKGVDNADGELDLSDAVRIITFLFMGGAPPERGVECIFIEGCPAVCEP